MTKKAPPRGRRFADSDIPLAKAMLIRGDRNQDVAAYFGVNSGRFEKVADDEVCYQDLTYEDRLKLPPPGPYKLDEQYVQLYRLVVQVNNFWDQGRLKRAKGLLEAVAKYGVFAPELYTDTEAALDELVRQDDGRLAPEGI